MPADNPVSWLLLMMLGLYLLCRFFANVINETERIKKEKERESREIFLENPIDKRNAVWYNSINDEQRRKK